MSRRSSAVRRSGSPRGDGGSLFVLAGRCACSKLAHSEYLIAPGSIPRSLLRTFNFEIWKLKCLGACPEDLYSVAIPSFLSHSASFDHPFPQLRRKLRRAFRPPVRQGGYPSIPFSFSLSAFIRGSLFSIFHHSNFPFFVHSLISISAGASPDSYLSQIIRSAFSQFRTHLGVSKSGVEVRLAASFSFTFFNSFGSRANRIAVS